MTRRVIWNDIEAEGELRSGWAEDASPLVGEPVRHVEKVVISLYSTGPTGKTRRETARLVLTAGHIQVERERNEYFWVLIALSALWNLLWLRAVRRRRP